MEEIPEEIYTLHQTCRTCLRNAHDKIMVPVFETDFSTKSAPLKMLEEFAFMKLKISENDGLPQQICWECMEVISNISTFRKICEKSQDTLTKFFKINCKEEELVENLNRTKNQQYSEFEFLNVEYAEFESKTKGEILDDCDQKIEIETEVISKTEKISAYAIDAATEDDENNDWENSNYNEKDDHLTDSENDKKKKNNVKYECEICSKPYKRKVDLARHVESHLGQSKVKKTRYSLKRHYIFVCNKCGKRFSKSKALQQHENEAQCFGSDNPQCRFCQEKFSKLSELEEHLLLMHPRDRPHMCPVCKKTFQSVSNRNTHLQSHNEANSFRCDVCGQGFKSKVYLSKHYKSVHTISDHQCRYCFMKFDNTVKYEYHLKSHDPNKKYKCKHCDKSFLQHHHLSNHERTHTGHRPFLCNHCGKDFKQECNFKLHLRIHSGVRPYICNVCGKDFIQRGSFVMHMRQHSGVRPFQCEHCGKDFVQKSSLTVHLRTHTGERPYKCDSCNKAFAQAQQLKYHRHSAHGTPSAVYKYVPKPSSDGRLYPYCCPLCNKGFKLPSSLSSHMKIHNEERKHVCPKCSNSFKRAEHLRIHINGVHLKQKPYACEMCNKTFAQSGDRNIHMRRHTGEKPHQCTYCKKNFRLLKAMRAHMRIHTGEKPYSCEFCKMDFMTYTALATHTMKHENETREAMMNMKTEDDLKRIQSSSIVTVSDSNVVPLISLSVPSAISSHTMKHNNDTRATVECMKNEEELKLIQTTSIVAVSESNIVPIISVGGSSVISSIIATAHQC